MRPSKFVIVLLIIIALVLGAFLLLNPGIDRLPATVDIGEAAVDQKDPGTLPAAAIPPKSDTPPLPSLEESFDQNFTDLDVGSWFSQSENGAKAKVTTVEGGYNGEGRALQVEVESLGSGHEWDIQVVRNGISVDTQTLQTLSAWVKGPTGAEIIFSVEAGTDFRLIQNIKVMLVGEWQKVVLEYGTQEPTVRTAMHFSLPHNEGAAILVDELKMESSL